MAKTKPICSCSYHSWRWPESHIVHVWFSDSLPPKSKYYSKRIYLRKYVKLRDLSISMHVFSTLLLFMKLADIFDIVVIWKWMNVCMDKGYRELRQTSQLLKTSVRECCPLFRHGHLKSPHKRKPFLESCRIYLWISNINIYINIYKYW